MLNGWKAVVGDLVKSLVIGRFMYMFDGLVVWLLNNVWFVLLLLVFVFLPWAACVVDGPNEKERKLGAAITKSESGRAFCKLIDPTAIRVGDHCLIFFCRRLLAE